MCSVSCTVSNIPHIIGPIFAVCTAGWVCLFNAFVRGEPLNWRPWNLVWRILRHQAIVWWKPHFYILNHLVWITNVTNRQTDGRNCDIAKMDTPSLAVQPCRSHVGCYSESPDWKPKPTKQKPRSRFFIEKWKPNQNWSDVAIAEP